MSRDAFQADVHIAEERLASEKRANFWIRLFTLGFFGNQQGIASATEQLEKSRKDLDKWDALISEADALDRRLEETIEIQGVRISRFTFVDLLEGEYANYGINWDSLREIVLSRDHYECQEGDGYCKGPLQVHHITALSKGGSNTLNNLVTLCRYHHYIKHDHLRVRINGNLRR